MKKSFCLFLLIGAALAQDSENPEAAKPDPKDAEIAYLKRKIEIYKRVTLACQDQQIDAAAKAGK